MNETIGNNETSETFLFDSLKQNQIKQQKKRLGKSKLALEIIDYLKENKICKPPVFNFGV